jgi:hypothetical protein
MRKRERRGERACELVSVWASTTTGRACTEQAMSIVRGAQGAVWAGEAGRRGRPLTRCLHTIKAGCLTRCFAHNQSGVSDTRCISKYYCPCDTQAPHIGQSLCPTTTQLMHAWMHAWPCMLQHTRAVGSEPATVDVRRGASYVSRSQAYVSRVSIRASQSLAPVEVNMHGRPVSELV